MKVYSRDSHPIAKATITMVHDTNQAMSGFYTLRKALEKEGNKDLLAVVERIERNTKKAIDAFYKVISDHEELPQ